MPILYVHGVNTRSRDGFKVLERYLRLYIAPAISSDPAGVLIDDAYWGDHGVSFAWDGASRPRSRMLGMGAQDRELTPIRAALTATTHTGIVDRMPRPPASPLAAGGLVAGGMRPAMPTDAGIRLGRLTPDELSDLLAAAIALEVPESEEQTRLILAADAVARDPAAQAELGTASSHEQELDCLLERVRQQSAADAPLRAAGLPAFLGKIRDRLTEGTGRALDLPTYALSAAAVEFRKPLNELLSVFIGDVFAYLNARGSADRPGDIPALLLEKLKQAHANKQQRNGEPVVVLTHSMGGQLVYDAVSWFLPRAADPGLAAVSIDFWCATASQVGFFEEAKLFLGSDRMVKAPARVGFPRSHLGIWWNLWDQNDVLSFTTADIFEGVRDEPYDSGMSLVSAHGGYLKRPSFYRLFARRLDEAKAAGWRTP